MSHRSQTSSHGDVMKQTTENRSTVLSTCKAKGTIDDFLNNNNDCRLLNQTGEQINATKKQRGYWRIDPYANAYNNEQQNEFQFSGESSDASSSLEMEDASDADKRP